MFGSFSFRSTPKPSPKELVKGLHHECYQIINEAIKKDEETIGVDNKDQAIQLYVKGLNKLDEALAIKFKKNDLDEKSLGLISKMQGNRAKVFERLKDLTQMRKDQSTALKSSNLRTNLTTNRSISTRNRPLSSSAVTPQYRRTQSKIETTTKGDDINNSLSNSDTNRTLTKSTSVNLSNLKGIDKKILDIILENVSKPNSKVKFDSISGLNTAKQALQEIVIWPLMNPNLFTGLRQPTRCILFFGPPGCGKTLLAKAIANECQANFISITASSLVSKWVGDSEKLVRALFCVARELKPCILFIDEIDSLLSERKDNESESGRRLKTEFFVELDGLRSEDNDQIFIIAATNLPYSLDEAALRRFSKRIFINLPDTNGRKELFQKLLSQQENQLGYNHIKKLAELTEGYSASDIHALCRDAALQPLREIETDKIKNLDPKSVRKIRFQDFEGSLKRIKRSCVDSTIEKLKAWSNQYGDSGEQSSS